MDEEDTQRSAIERANDGEEVFAAGAFFLLLTQLASVRSQRRRGLLVWRQQAATVSSCAEAASRQPRESGVAGVLDDLPPCDEALLSGFLSPLDSLSAASLSCDSVQQWSTFVGVLAKACASKAFLTTTRKRQVAERLSGFFALLYDALLDVPAEHTRPKRPRGDPAASQPRAGRSDAGVVVCAVADMLAAHALFLQVFVGHCQLWRLAGPWPAAGASKLAWRTGQHRFLQLIELTVVRIKAGPEEQLCAAQLSLLPRLATAIEACQSSSGEILADIYLNRIARCLRCR